MIERSMKGETVSLPCYHQKTLHKHGLAIKCFCYIMSCFHDAIELIHLEGSVFSYQSYRCRTRCGFVLLQCTG